MALISITNDILALLFCTGILAGFVDSIAGGGGLITLPVLLSVGFPPQIALGTNKLQGSFGTLFSSYNYIKKGKADLKECGVGIVATFLGAALGSWSIQQFQPTFIRRLIPILLLLVFLYTVFSRNLGYKSKKAIMPKKLFFIVFGLGLGFYDGFFGPGTGSFWTAALLICLGFEMTRAAGTTRIMNFTSNIVALLVFIIGGRVMYSAGLSMALGQMIGARLGSNFAIQKGAGFIRPVFLIIVFLTIVRIVYVINFKS